MDATSFDGKEECMSFVRKTQNTSRYVSLLLIVGCEEVFNLQYSDKDKLLCFYSSEPSRKSRGM